MKRAQLFDFVATIPKGKFVGIEFVKADGTLRNAQVAFGVRNPSHCTKPGEGTRQGVSFAEAKNNGVLKFFEANKENADGTHGNYRSARVERILSITYDGVRHEMED